MEAEPVPMPWLDEAIAALVQINTALPILFTTIAGIAALWKAATGEDVSVADLADRIEARVALNANFGAAEIARLRALLEQGA